MLQDGATVELRPATGWRVVAWIFAAFGALFGLSALAGHDLAAEVLMGAFGFAVMVGAVNAATYTVACSREGLRVRGLRRRFVPAGLVESVAARSVTGYASPLIRIEVHLLDRRKIKLTTLQRYDTAKNRRRTDADVSRIRQALGLPPVATT